MIQVNMKYKNMKYENIQEYKNIYNKNTHQPKKAAPPFCFSLALAPDPLPDLYTL